MFKTENSIRINAETEAPQVLEADFNLCEKKPLDVLKKYDMHALSYLDLKRPLSGKMQKIDFYIPLRKYGYQKYGYRTRP